jgi:hypothetical protein
MSLVCLAFFCFEKAERMEWSFDETDVRKARKRAESMGRLKKNWNGFDSVVTGFIGEVVFLRALQGMQGIADNTHAQVELADTHDYDVIVRRLPNDSHSPSPSDVSEGMRIEVKTRRTRCRMRPGFVNCVSGHNFTQQTDIYVFLRVLYTGAACGKVFFSGACTRRGFHQKKTFAATGSRVGSLRIKHDCFWIPVNACVSFLSLYKEILRFTSGPVDSSNANNTIAKSTKGSTQKNKKEEAHIQNRPSTSPASQDGPAKRKITKPAKPAKPAKTFKITKPKKQPSSATTLSDCIWNILG